MNKKLFQLKNILVHLHAIVLACQPQPEQSFLWDALSLEDSVFHNKLTPHSLCLHIAVNIRIKIMTHVGTG